MDTSQIRKQIPYLSIGYVDTNRYALDTLEYVLDTVYLQIRSDTLKIRYQIRSWIQRLFRYVMIRIGYSMRYKQDTSYLRVRLKYASDTHEYISIQHGYTQIQANTHVFVACCCTNVLTARFGLTCGVFWPVPRPWHQMGRPQPPGLRLKPFFCRP